jgi:hypothetical protein
MRLIRTFSLFVATTVVLLHSMVAHSHHGEYSEIEHIAQHQNASNILDFIALGFHGEHLDAQMEGFTMASQLNVEHGDFIQLVAILSSLFTIEYRSENSELNTHQEVAIQGNFFPRAIGLRGPPSLS